MADGDFWRPVRDRWAELSQTVLDPRGQSADSKFVIKRWWNPFPSAEMGIAFTGMRGAGKTTLHKAMRRRLPVGEYVERSESPDREVDRFVAVTRNGKRRVQLVVVPGQKDSTAGTRTINAFFREGHSPTGVVHAVSWGYSTIWDSGSQRTALQLVRAGGRATSEIDRLRAYNMEHELDDFRQTRDLLQQAWLRRHTGTWLILAVSKVDLYRDADSLREAGEYYIPAADPNHDSPFAAELRGLADSVGQQRIRVAVLPVCSYLESYPTVGTEMTPSRGDLDLTSVLMAGFSDKIGEFCGVHPS